ncbi:MAG: thermonuclease family protein [Verrucomicrobiales bacterium]|nr:thermonuclease family protein [Verrucomicrobiales bacterium]
MKLRDLLLNLSITAALVVVIVLVYVVLDHSRPEVPRAIPVSEAEIRGLDLGAKPVRDNFLVLPQALLVESRGNEADTLRMQVDGEELIFVLYFVDALDASWTHPQRINDQARWFGNASSDRIVETGIEALNFVRTLLTTKPFRVMTRWERVPNTSRYYALIIVEEEPGRMTYLQDILVREGYARIQGVTTPLPGDSRDEAHYLAYLRQLANEARREKRGIWKNLR